MKTSASRSVAAPLSRRAFLRSTALAAAGLAAGAGPAVAAAAAPKGGKDIDAHVHVWTPDLGKYPLDPAYRASDMQPRSFTPEELFAHTRPNGVNRIVLIQMSYYRYDNQYMLDTIRRFPGVFSGVAILDESLSRPADRMRQLQAQGVRGFRIHPGQLRVDTWIGSPGMAAMWSAAADLGLAMCPLINPDALPAIGQMCERYPKTRVVIDHFARIGIDGNIRSEQLDALCALAKFPNTYVKTSAFYALGRKAPPYTDLGPMIQRVRDAFGAKRLMWASDCPFQVGPGHNYADAIALVRERLDFLKTDERAWMLRKTAEKVFFT